MLVPVFEEVFCIDQLLALKWQYLFSNLSSSGGILMVATVEGSGKDT